MYRKAVPEPKKERRGLFVESEFDQADSRCGQKDSSFSGSPKELFNYGHDARISSRPYHHSTFGFWRLLDKTCSLWQSSTSRKKILRGRRVLPHEEKKDPRKVRKRCILQHYGAVQRGRELDFCNNKKAALLKFHYRSLSLPPSSPFSSLSRRDF